MPPFLGNILADLRKSKRETQRSLARKIGVKERTLQTWEQGTSEPGGRNLSKICVFFGVTQDYLFKETGTENATSVGLANLPREVAQMDDLIDKAKMVLGQPNDNLYRKALEENIKAFFHAVASESKKEKIVSPQVIGPGGGG